MAIAVDTNTRNVRPVNNPLRARYVVGADVTAGEPVTMQADGFVDPCAAATMASSLGIALKSVTAGGTVDVVYLGEVEFVTGATPGAIVYAGNTAGTVSESAGTNAVVLGTAITATMVMINVVPALA